MLCCGISVVLSSFKGNITVKDVVFFTYQTLLLVLIPALPTQSLYSHFWLLFIKAICIPVPVVICCVFEEIYKCRDTLPLKSSGSLRNILILKKSTILFQWLCVMFINQPFLLFFLPHSKFRPLPDPESNRKRKLWKSKSMLPNFCSFQSAEK